MAIAGVKLANEGGFATNCFPAHYKFGRTSSDGSGAWAVAYHAEERRRFKAALCAEPRTYSCIKEERKKAEQKVAELAGNRIGDIKDEADNSIKVLDKSFLMTHCCVDDPADLCSVNIAGIELMDVKEDDLLLFKNVAYVNAAENFLPFDAFCGFPSLRELEVPLNGLQNLKISHTDFTNLEMLDISYNNLSQDDIMTLGLLTRLKVLYLTGNNFSQLPPDLAMPYLSREKQVHIQRFACLEVLLLDDNKLMDVSVFAALAGLPKLHHLDLSKNEIFFVPQLKRIEGRVMTQDGKERRSHKRSGGNRRSGRNLYLHNLGEQRQASVTNMELEKEKTSSSTLAFGDEVKVEVAVKKEEDRLENAEFMAEDFSTGDLSARIKEFVLENEKSQFPLQKNDPELPPFSELRYLNLADNKIYEEDSLLALAAWPMLQEVDIFNNPLTTETTGDPPLLKMFLQDRLGMKLNRIKPQEASRYVKKRKVDIRPKYRKISEIVPKIPKLSVEEKMTLQLTPPPEQKRIELNPSSFHREAHRGLHLQKYTNKSVLPPIPTADEEELAESWAGIEATKEGMNECNDVDQKIPGEHGRDNSEPFFMTQLNDADEKRSDAMKNKISFTDTEKSHISIKNVSHPAVDDRYKGYELLLAIEELENEPVLPPARDIQGNIRALKHTLNHLLVYRDPAVELNKVNKMVQEYRRVPVPPSKPHKTYQEKVDEVLANLKTRSTIEEENLATVLKDKNKFHKQFPEAKKLLAQVQRRYNTVRHHFIADAKQAGDIAANVLELLPPVEMKSV